MDRDRDKIVPKAEWDAMQTFTQGKFNAERIVAIRPDGKGDSTETHLLWENTKGLSAIG